MARGLAMSARAPDFPVLDLGPYTAGEAGALERAAEAFRQALETLGFFAVVNHGVPAAAFEAVFAEARRFHDLPLAEKLQFRFAESYAGYLPAAEFSIKTSTVNANDKPDLNEAYFVEREAPPPEAHLAADPGRAAGFASPNRWPAALPGFRETVLDYYAQAEALARRLLPVYARALGLAPEHFRPAFHWPQAALRLSHYPPAAREANQFGIAPHTDANFFTLLATHGAPGLHIQAPDGGWLEAPEVPGGFIVNAGEMMRRWSNDRFLATRHMAVNDSDRHRYAAVFFFAPDLDYEIRCLPTCSDADNPPRYPPVTYREYRRWFMDTNYRTDLKAPVEEAAP